MAAPPDFSLILGGPLYQLLRRAHLSGDALELLRRRVTVAALLTWLPLLVLSIAEGHAWGDSVKVPFLYDVDVHARFLLALPLFVVAEIVVHHRMRPVVAAFLNRGLIPDAARAKFDAAISAACVCATHSGRVLLIAFVYGIGVLVIWRNNAAIDVARGTRKREVGGCNQPGPAGGSASSACRYSSSFCFAGISGS